MPAQKISMSKNTTEETTGPGGIEITSDIKKHMKNKLDPLLQDIVMNSATVPVIVQTPDGLKDDDRSRVNKVGGKIKDDLYIINAFSADIPTEGILQLIQTSRVLKVYYDAEVRAV